MPAIHFVQYTTYLFQVCCNVESNMVGADVACWLTKKEETVTSQPPRAAITRLTMEPSVCVAPRSEYRDFRTLSGSDQIALYQYPGRTGPDVPRLGQDHRERPWLPYRRYETAPAQNLREHR